jgi:hypothetical protein
MQPNIIKNFISEEIASYIHNYLRPKAIINPHGLLNVYLNEEERKNFKGDITYDLINLIIDSVAHEFNIEKEKISLNRINYQVLTNGQGLGYHTDNRGAYEGTMKNAGYSVLIYLTDTYTGGEILFYDDSQGQNSSSYHPSPGTLIYFRGDEDHPHSVNEVIDGERANLILFYDVQEGNNAA